MLQPWGVVSHTSHYFPGEFATILSLTYLATGESFVSMRAKFGGNPDFWACLFSTLLLFGRLFKINGIFTHCPYMPVYHYYVRFNDSILLLIAL